MLERRNQRRRQAAAVTAGAIVVGLVAAIGARLWAKALRRPVDTLALIGAGTLSVIIVVNAVFLQSGSRAAPFFANPPPPPAAHSARPTRGARLPPGTRALQAAAGRRNDPIAELISSFIDAPTRVTAVQRVLSDYGYGQIKPSGVVDQETRAAIEKFESEHHMPVTGRLSDRLMSELSTMAGHPL